MQMKLRFLTLVSALTAFFVVTGGNRLPEQRVEKASAVSIFDAVTPVEHRRMEDQTFLTYPEWFLVYSPREYAGALERNEGHAFPFVEHIGQLWQGYAAVHQATRERYEFNGDYHLMIAIIGASTTGEYSAKWLYESTIGRCTHALSRGPTSEDQVAAKVARDYEQFLDIEPWYKFDYWNALKRVWQPSIVEGGLAHTVRKWERKYVLSTEYLFKAVYAEAMKRAAGSAYGTISTETYCVVQQTSKSAELPEGIQFVEPMGGGMSLVSLPRYQRFTDRATQLTRAGYEVVEIAGNRDAVFLTAIVTSDFHWARPLMFAQPILTEPNQRRIGFEVPVAELHVVVRELQAAGATLEHIYDY